MQMTRLWFWMALSLHFWGLCTYLMLLLPYQVWRSTIKKTEALSIGVSKSSNLIFPSSKPITWANEKVFALGVWLSTLENKSLNPNFIEKIEKIRSILDNWSARRLTLLGKITIIKTLAVSQIVYALSSLPTPPDILKTIYSILYDFFWNGKGDKIKRMTMINGYAKGGLKMLDIQSFSESLKMKWIQGYLNEEIKGSGNFFWSLPREVRRKTIVPKQFETARFYTAQPQQGRI